jgi:hypothetical protein
MSFEEMIAPHGMLERDRATVNVLPCAPEEQSMDTTLGDLGAVELGEHESQLKHVVPSANVWDSQVHDSMNHHLVNRLT